MLGGSGLERRNSWNRVSGRGRAGVGSEAKEKALAVPVILLKWEVM